MTVSADEICPDHFSKIFSQTSSRSSFFLLQIQEPLRFFKRSLIFTIFKFNFHLWNCLTFSRDRVKNRAPMWFVNITPSYFFIFSPVDKLSRKGFSSFFSNLHSFESLTIKYGSHCLNILTFGGQRIDRNWRLHFCSQNECMNFENKS